MMHYPRDRGALFTIMDNHQDSFTLREEKETSIYLNGDGGITISQFRSDEPESICSFSTKARVLEVIAALSALAEQANFMPFEEEEDVG